MSIVRVKCVMFSSLAYLYLLTLFETGIDNKPKLYRYERMLTVDIDTASEKNKETSVSPRYCYYCGRLS